MTWLFTRWKKWVKPFYTIVIYSMLCYVSPNVSEMEIIGQKYLVSLKNEQT